MGNRASLKLALDDLSHDGRLTYILGARCSDGIVFVGDRRVTRGAGGYLYEDKIFSDVTNVVIAASGIVGVFDKFRRQIRDVASKNPEIEVGDFIAEAERIVHKLNQEYYERARGGIDLLVAYGRMYHGELQYVTPRGVGEVVRHSQAIGSGEPYGAYLLKKLWKDDLTMKQAAALGWMIITHIEENELDQAVGVGKGKPQIWWVPDWPPDTQYDKLSEQDRKRLATREATEEEMAAVAGVVEQTYPKIGDSLNSISLEPLPKAEPEVFG